LIPPGDLRFFRIFFRGWNFFIMPISHVALAFPRSFPKASPPSAHPLTLWADADPSSLTWAPKGFFFVRVAKPKNSEHVHHLSLQEGQGGRISQACSACVDYYHSSFNLRVFLQTSLDEDPLSSVVHPPQIEVISSVAAVVLHFGREAFLLFSASDYILSPHSLFLF